MTTANDIVTRSLKKLTDYEAGEVLSAEDLVDGLASLNGMLHAWALEYGVDLGHSDLASTDTITLPSSHLEAVENNLALRLAALFSSQIRGETARFAERGMRALQAAYADVGELSLDPALRNRMNNTGNETFNA